MYKQTNQLSSLAPIELEIKDTTDTDRSAGMLIHINGKFTMRKFKPSLLS
jgi:hypothetical protein